MRLGALKSWLLGSAHTHAGERLHKSSFWLVVGAWTCVAAGSLGWNLARSAAEVKSVTFQTARALLDKDLLYREWSLLHGGVYVWATTPQPLPAKPRDPERDIVTPAGQRLTLLNPAEVSRQIFQIQDQQMGVRGHLTSLKPIRPTNRPDSWEQQGLEAFERGASEVSSVEASQGQRYCRMMRPLTTEPSCLRCHEEQGRKPGEIRGGISVTVPLRLFTPPNGDLRLILAHTGLWLVGMTGLGLGARRFHRHNQARRQAERERERLLAELQDALANVKTLYGLLPMCASCKKIRNQQDQWVQIEVYLEQHSQLKLSHGFCPECAHRLYPEVFAAPPPPGASPNPPDEAS